MVYDAHSMQELERHERLAIYIHQMAVDRHGDIYTATVYPDTRAKAAGPRAPATAAGRGIQRSDRAYPGSATWPICNAAPKPPSTMRLTPLT